MTYSIEEDIVSLQKMIGKPISEIIYYRHLSLKGKMEYIDKLYQKAKCEMIDPTCKDDPTKYWQKSSMVRGWNVEKAKDGQEHACICCGIGIVKKYDHFSYLLKPHRIVYGYLKGDYVPENTVMLCYKCHDSEYKFFQKNKHRLYLDYQRRKLFSWDKLIDVSFDIFKEFIVENHEHTDIEIENDISQEIEQYIP